MPHTNERVLSQHLRETGEYQTPARHGVWSRRVPMVVPTRLYGQYVVKVVYLGWLAIRGTFNRDRLREGAGSILLGVEWCGGALDFQGFEHLAGVEGGAVLVSNHMSTLETVIFAYAGSVFKETTFILKESLLHYPFFGPLVTAMNPVAVKREDPREDLMTVLREGPKRLEAGDLMVVFPQSTRTREFDPRRFNSLGVKLAKRAGVPVIPAAVKTDMWGIGKWVKDFGPVDSRKVVHVELGEPFAVTAPKADHQRCIDFIQERLQAWDNAED